METKTCYKCGEEKPLSEFSKLSRNKDKHHNICRLCKREHERKYYKTNSIRMKINKVKKENRISERYWAVNSISNHKRRGYIINITNDELEKMALNTKICIYCGSNLIYKNNGKGDKINDNRPSMDRINNENEININNVQIICSRCNVTKLNRTHDEFIEYCKIIAEKFKYF